MSSTRKPIDLGGSVARNDARVPAAVEPPKPPKPSREATRTTTVRIRESQHRQLQYYCLDNDTTIQAVIEKFLEELLKDTPDRRGG